MIERMALNTEGKDYVVGDLHGEYDRLMQALEALKFDTAVDRLFAVGDLIDRGPSSMQCLALMDNSWFFSVRGNHEAMAINALKGRMWNNWQENGGRWVLKENPPEVSRVLNQAWQAMPLAYEIEVSGGRRVGIVHANPPARWSELSEMTEEVETRLLWSRRRHKTGDTTPVEGIDAVVVGHTVVGAPMMLGNVRYIDTGAYHTRRLTVEPLEQVLACL